MKIRFLCLLFAGLFGWLTYTMFHEPQPMLHALSGVFCALTFFMFSGVILPPVKTDQNVYIGSTIIDSPDEHPHVFGETGKWTPLYSPERTIAELTDEHLVNATLWIDRKLTQAVSHTPNEFDQYAGWLQSEWRWIKYLVGKSDELKAECFKRGISVPVGKEPPPADAYKPTDKTGI